MNISKHVKKGIRKNNKSEQAKSLADAMKKVKTDTHTKKFSKPEAGEKKKKWTDKKGGGGGDNKKFSGKKRSYDAAAAAKKQAELDALTPSAKKKKLRQDRQAKKPNFSLVENMKEFWNSARVKTLSKEDREALIQTMMKGVTGRILQVTLRHDASRAVQCILQFGSPQQRRLILEEMSAKLYEVCMHAAAHNSPPASRYVMSRAAGLLLLCHRLQICFYVMNRSLTSCICANVINCVFCCRSPRPPTATSPC
jgi:hypothetical protein